MSYHTDKTAAMAIGNVSREWKRMVRLAYNMRCRDNMTDTQQQLFRGIYSRLLTDPIWALEAELRIKNEEPEQK